MKRFLVLLCLAVVAGCEQPIASDAASKPASEATASGLPQAPIPRVISEIEFSDWPTATEKPVLVDPIVASFCRAPSQTELKAREAERKRHGPHYKPSIVVRTNAEAIGAFKAGDAPLPVGTIIIKEKHNDLLAKGPPADFGAMVKREPGYDPEHGDWEYLYVVSKPEKTVTRGKLESCIDCHSHAKDKDYLFRTYLAGQSAPVSKW